ncbi:MAG: peptidase U32 family protein [Solirubrobacterales bacterium]
MSHQLELLAPAGRWPHLTAAVEAGADAVYLGGKRFNMRLLRPDFNFSDQELRDAAAYCHDHGVRLYVTVNNLYYDDELPALADYLSFLDEIGVDAMILQDLAIVSLVRKLGLKTPLHASVQMGVRNVETARLFTEFGISQAILSKNLTLKEIRQIHENSSLVLEYFVHGDLCITHTGQCYMSGMLFAESGNRGRCKKPCRWRWAMTGSDTETAAQHRYRLGHKDLCLYEQIAQLSDAGIRSLKVEGRMRDPEYVAFLTAQYRSAIDRLTRPDSAAERSGLEALEARRVRNYTTGGLFGFDDDLVDETGDREPPFPTAPEIVPRLTSVGSGPLVFQDERRPLLYVSTLEPGGIPALAKAGADGLIFPVPEGTPRKQNSVLGWDMLAELPRRCHAAGMKAVLELPRIVSANNMTALRERLNNPLLKEYDGVIAHDPGSLQVLAQDGFVPWAGYGLNLTNTAAVDRVASVGASVVQPFIELSLDQLSGLTAVCQQPLNVMVHGAVCGMVTDHCPYRSEQQGCSNCHREAEPMALMDELGQCYPWACDADGRGYLYAPRILSLYGFLPEIAASGVHSVRIEGIHDSLVRLLAVTSIFKDALDPARNEPLQREEGFQELVQWYPEGLTGRPFVFEPQTD